MIKESRVAWTPSWRIIPTRNPAVRIFSDLARPEDEELLAELVDATNPRPQLQAERPILKEPGGLFIAATIAYRSETRFTDGSFGAYYCAQSLDTAIAETVYHRQRFLRDTEEPPMLLPMCVIVANLDAALKDLRRLRRQLPKVYDKRDYRVSQRLGASFKEEGADGVVYSSVRHPGGECAAVFSERALSHCRRERLLSYEWNGARIEKVFELREYLREG